MLKLIHLRLGAILLWCFTSFSLIANSPLSAPENAPDAFGVIIDVFPENQHFYPRNLSTNKGTAVIQGKVYGISGYDQLRVKLYKDGTLANTFEQTLNYVGNLAQFDFNISINAELTNHKLVLVGVNNGVETIESTADEVVAGDVYVINGQSNAVAAASIHPTDLDPFIRSYTNANGWGYINLSFPGQWGGRLAKRILDDQGIPVAIFNEAQGAQQIGFFLRHDNSPSSGNYGAQRTRLTNAGVVDDVRAMIWFQGEADSYDVSTSDYKSDFQDLYNDWGNDYNFEEVYIFQTRYGACGSSSADILEAHRQLAEELYGLHIISTNNTSYDGCHFPYSNGYQVLGDRLYRLVDRDMYNGSSSNTASPDVSEITVDDDLITISMNGTNNLSKVGTPWADFELVGGSVDITSGSVSGNKIYLNLSGEAAGVTGVSYVGHLGNANNWIVTPSDFSILSFKDFPITDPIPDGNGGGSGGGNNGGPADCNNINVTSVSGGLNVAGLDGAPVSQVQIFNSSWATVFNCAGNCAATENINLPAGQYYVYVKYFNSSWQPICEINETMTVGGGPVVDNDNDGVPADQDCDDNDASLPATPGASCNDNNSNTTNDIIQSDGCTCAGTTNTGGGGGGTGGAIDCNNILISSDGTTLTIAGLGTAPVSKLQVFDENWSIVFNCFGDCADTENIDLAEGLYRIKAALNNSSWQEICEISETVTLETGGSTGGGGGGTNPGGGGGTNPTENGIDLELTMTLAETEYFIYEYLNYTLTVTNNGTDASSGIEVENKLPTGTVYSSHVASNGGDYNPWNGIWKVGDLAGGETAVVELRFFILNDDADINNFAQVSSATGTDVDSAPGNNNTNTPSEDDEATVSVSAGVRTSNAIGVQLAQNRFIVLTDLYPNPASEQLNMNIVANEEASAEMKVYDSFGGLKKSLALDMAEGVNQVELNIEELPTGMYYILFETNNRHEPIRFVKQRL